MKVMRTALLAFSTFAAHPALGDWECSPLPVFLNVDYTASTADALFYLGPTQDQPLHLWGEREQLRALTEADQAVTNGNGLNHRLPGFSIQIDATRPCGGDWCDHELPPINITLDPQYEARCIYGPLRAPTPTSTLTMRAPTNCVPQPQFRIGNRTAYKALKVEGCRGHMSYDYPNVPKATFDLGTLALLFNDGFVGYRNAYLPGAMTVFRGSLQGDRIAGVGLSFSDLLNTTGAFVYRISIDMPTQSEDQGRR